MKINKTNYYLYYLHEKTHNMLINSIDSYYHSLINYSVTFQFTQTDFSKKKI